MAKLFDLIEPEFSEWVATRPPGVQELVKKLPPNLLYRMSSTGHRCTIYSYSENNTVTVAVTGKYNYVVFPRRVFGINPVELTECDLPSPDEILGEELTEREDIEEYLRNHIGEVT